MKWEDLFDWGELRFERKLTAEDFSVESLPYEEIPDCWRADITSFRRLRTDSRESAIRSFYSLRREVTLRGCSRVHVPEGTTVIHAWCDDCEDWVTFNTENGQDHCDGCDNTIPRGGLNDEEKVDLAHKQFMRGYCDAKAGHSPSVLRGNYSDGYASAKSDYTVEQGKVWAKGVRDREKTAEHSLHMKYAGARKRIEELEAEVESERKRLGDECDRLVFEWHDELQKVRTRAESAEAKCATLFEINTGLLELVEKWETDARALHDEIKQLEIRGHSEQGS